MQIRKVTHTDKDKLCSYFRNLSEETKSRFGPHPFNESTVGLICNGEYDMCTAYLCLIEGMVAAYAVVKLGYIEGDRSRYDHYSIELNHEHDYTLAPSVADRYQSQGIGSQMFEFVENDLRKKGADKIILWGGVQAGNQRAVNYYYKYGFEKQGAFEHNGNNYDMVKFLK